MLLFHAKVAFLERRGTEMSGKIKFKPSHKTFNVVFRSKVNTEHCNKKH